MIDPTVISPRRKGAAPNPNSRQYHGDTEGHAPKPVSCKLKTDPEDGRVMNRGANAGEEAPPGFRWDNEGYLVNDRNQRVYGDHDLQGAYRQTSDPNAPYERAGSNYPRYRNRLNEDVGQPPPMFQHGANDDYRKRNGTAGRNPGADERFTVVEPNGTVKRINSTAELEQYYRQNGIPWPYPHYEPPAPAPPPTAAGSLAACPVPK